MNFFQIFNQSLDRFLSFLQKKFCIYQNYKTYRKMIMNFQ